MVQIKLRLSMVALGLFLLAPCLSQAEEIRLNSIGVRGGVSGSFPIEEKGTESFQEYDVMQTGQCPGSGTPRQGRELAQD
ncbi:MAG: hypothetical protein ABI604_01700 [Nitrospirota bacterium]